MMPVSDDKQRHAFDTVTDALMWSGWVAHMRGHGTSRGQYLMHPKPFSSDDVILQLNKAVTLGKLTHDHKTIVKYFVRQQRTPDGSDRDWLHKMWHEAIEVLEPMLRSKGIVYDPT